MSARPVVWVTRPQPGADRTAAALAEAGYDPFVLPLTEIRALDPGLSHTNAAKFDAVAATSANALRHAPKALVAALRQLPLYAVGDATAAEAEALGFSAVVSAGGAVDDLVTLIAEREKHGATILYLCGRVRTGDLEGKLAEKDLPCRPVEVYSTEIVSYPTEYLRDAVNRRAPDAILFHSGQSALAFAQTVYPLFAQSFENTLFFVISERVAERLPEGPRSRTVVAPEPTGRALLAALGKSLPTDRN